MTVQETKIEESFRVDRELRAGKRGIKRYLLYDLSNPIDAEIVRRIQGRNAYVYTEQFCRYALCKRLKLGNYINYHGVDQMIEQRLLKHCLKNGKTRNEYVRELFCIQLNIKGYEVCRDLQA